MVIFYNAKSAIDHMYEHVKHTDDITSVYIGTYGIWVGNGCYQIPSKLLLDLLNGRNISVDLIVGYTSDRVLDYCSNRLICGYPHIHKYISYENHAKYILCSDGYAMIGSANLNDSTWGEIVSCDYLTPLDYNSVLEFHQHSLQTAKVMRQLVSKDTPDVEPSNTIDVSSIFRLSL